MTTYDAIRRQLRTLESNVDAKLTTYSKVASSIPRASSYDLDAGIGGSSHELEVEIDGLLDRLRDLNEELGRVLDRPDAPSGTAVSHAVQRHREVLQDYTRDFLRTKANVQTALDQANLLSNVRNDIETYKTARSSTTDALLSERNHIDSSHLMADDLLTHAHETRAEFSRQRTQLGSIQTRMSNVLSNFPGMNNIIGMIQTRRRRDAIIMGCLIGLLIILLWTYMSR